MIYTVHVFHGLSKITLIIQNTPYFIMIIQTFQTDLYYISSEFDERSVQFSLFDHFIYSHNLFPCVSMDIIRRKLIMVTIGTLRGNSYSQIN